MFKNKYFLGFTSTPKLTTNSKLILVCGFSLIELMISISIISLVFSTVFYNYSSFNDRLALTAAAEEMALAIRETQSYGLTVKELSPGGGKFNYAYGIYFNPTTDPSDYYIFADTDQINPINKKYDVGSGCSTGGTECLSKQSLRNGVKITSICNAGACPGTPACATSLAITFLRPSTNADINFIDNGGNICVASDTTAKVILTSPQGKTLTMTILRTGQISTQ